MQFICFLLMYGFMLKSSWNWWKKNDFLLIMIKCFVLKESCVFRDHHKF